MNWRSTRTKARPFVALDEGAEVAGVEIVGGLATGQFIALGEGAHLIGRVDDAAIQLADEGVSRKHAELRIDGEGQAHVRDLESRNGTYLNGEKVRSATVQVGDRIQIGSAAALRFVFRVEEPKSAQGKALGEDVLLSPREREVAVLVAQGSTNAEIAEALGISPKTVSTHLGNIFERLGINKRAQLARYVVERNLLPR